MTKNSDGTFIFIRNKKDKFYFNAQGLLTSIQDKNENAITLTYNSAKELTKVSNSRSQFIAITWLNGKISEVKDHTLRKVMYAYNANGNLIGTTNPAGVTREYTYDSFNRVTSLENELGGQTLNTYYGETDHRILNQTDPRGNSMSFSYGSNYTSITYPDGYNVIELYNRYKQLSQKTENYNGTSATYTYEYTIDGFVSTITDPAQQVSYMAYDENGNPTAVQDNAGNITRMTYDEDGNLLTTTNAAGDVAKMTYDAKGNMTSSESYEGRKTTYVINPDGTPASSVSPKGNAEGVNTADYTSTFAYANGYLSALIDANGNKNSIITDSLGRPIKTIGAKGNVPGANPDEYSSYITYDVMGNVIKTKDANGNENTSTYDAGGNVLTFTDPLGRVSTFTYDVMGNLLTSKDSLGNESSYEYDNRNRLTKITDAKGKISEITYDQAGRVTKTKDAAGREAQQSWNNLNQLVSTTDAAGKVSEFTYDSLGNLKTSKNQLGHITSYSYDALNRLKSTVDAENRSSTLSYTKDSLLSSVLRPDGLSESTTYDLAGQAISSTNAAGKARTWTYNNLGQLSQYKDEAGTPEAYTYDVAGQSVSVTRTDGSVINKIYDNRGLLTSVDYPNTDMDIAYTHDVLGRIVTEQKANGPVITYAYNEIGQLTSRGPPGKKVEYTYDELGNLKSLKYPSGRIVNYTVNDVSETTNLNTAGINDIAFSYNSKGQNTETTLPTGVKTVKSYDDAGQLTGINLNTGSSVNLYAKNYSYTPTGNVSQQGTSPDVPTLDDFSYDPLSRLTEQKKNADGTSVNAYEYNSIGNLTKSNGTIQTFDDTGKILSSGTKTFGYDNAGNRTATANSADASKNVSYDWNEANLLTSVGVANKDIDYSYDASGFISSRTKDGAVTNEFIWDTNGSIPLLLDDGKYEYIYGIDRTPIAQILKSSGEVSYLHGDALGSVVSKTSAQGTLTGETSYSPYGKTTTTRISSFGFAGEWTDEDTGYSYLRARWLDTETGTFLSRDPAVQSTGDAYGYASGNPLRYIDPLGLCSVGNGDLGNLASDCYSFAENPAFLELNNFMAGVGDTASMGGTKAIRELTGTNDQVDSCSAFYTAGEMAGTAASMVTPGGFAKASGTTVKNAFKNTYKTYRSVKNEEAGSAMVPFSGGIGKTAKEWDISSKAVAVKSSKKGNNKYYKQKENRNGESLWWSDDFAGHGGSRYKVYKPNAKGLKWIADADKDGRYIEDKHKGPQGKFIPWDDLKG